MRITNESTLNGKGGSVVYCIAILTDQEQEGQKSAEYIRNYCTEKACLSTD